MVSLPLWIYDNGKSFEPVVTIDPKAIKWARTILRTYRMVSTVTVETIGELVGCPVSYEALRAAGGQSDYMGSYVLHTADHAVYTARLSALNELSLRYPNVCDKYRRDSLKLWKQWYKEDNR